MIVIGLDGPHETPDPDLWVYETVGGHHHYGPAGDWAHTPNCPACTGAPMPDDPVEIGPPTLARTTGDCVLCDAGIEPDETICQLDGGWAHLECIEDVGL